MDWSLKEIADELVLRLQFGPMQFRLFMQPMVAICFGIIDGKRDAREGLPPFILGLITGRGGRLARVKSVLWRLRLPIVIAIAMDCVVQYLMFGLIRPVVALTFGSALMCAPYSGARACANRFFSWRQGHRAKVEPPVGIVGGRL